VADVTRRHRFAAGTLALAVLLAATSLAWAGGDFVDIAVGSGRVWFVGEGTVRSYDATRGRQLSMPRLVGTAYPLSVVLAPGATWVASVENGYVRGTLSRIDQRTGRARVVWRRQDGSVQEVAAGAGSIWALIGSARAARTSVARFALDGRLVRMYTLADAGRLAADGAGCWVSTSRGLLRIDREGTVHRALRGVFDGVATGGGGVWLPRATSLLRLDERTGRTRTLVTGRLRLGGFQHEIAVADDTVWVLEHPNTLPTRSRLVRMDSRTGTVTGSITMQGIADAIVVRPGAVWVASVASPAGGTASGESIVRVDPRRLRGTLTIRVP
jgi:hypothetical protein